MAVLVFCRCRRIFLIRESEIRSTLMFGAEVDQRTGAGRGLRKSNKYLLFMRLFSFLLERHINVKRRLDTCRGQIWRLEILLVTGIDRL
jgi:hypothetical protein